MVSILAFGFGTGTILVTGHYQTNSTNTTLNTTKQSEFPTISNQNTVTTSNNSQNSKQQNGQNNNNPSYNNTSYTNR